MLPRWVNFGEKALDFLFPKYCVGCGHPGEFFCGDCLRELPRIYDPLCPACGRPQTNEVLCPECVQQAAAIDGMRAPFKFEGTIRKAVHDFKYRNVRALAKPLSGLMYRYISNRSLIFDAIIPIPLHSKRLKERGYNQSELLAGNLGKITGVPVIRDGLFRIKYTVPQVKTSSLAERRNNVNGAFSGSDNAVKGKSILLIDDVATSGLTMNAAAAVLKSSGAGSVWGLTLAREV